MIHLDWFSIGLELNEFGLAARHRVGTIIWPTILTDRRHPARDDMLLYLTSFNVCVSFLAMIQSHISTVDLINSYFVNYFIR